MTPELRAPPDGSAADHRRPLHRPALTVGGRGAPALLLGLAAGGCSQDRQPWAFTTVSPGAAEDTAPEGPMWREPLRGPHRPQLVRFVAIGDAGEGNADQYAVAAAIAEVCAGLTAPEAPGCDFVLYLGDNFYQVGVEGIDDPQFQSKFEAPYAALDLPFYPVLGNHDYGTGSLEAEKADAQIAYTRRSTKWTLPARHYHFTAAHAHFLALDTNAAMLVDVWGDRSQEQTIREGLAAAAAEGALWRVAYGHHPYKSNGPHGNAGAYEGQDWAPVVNGAGVQALVEGQLCGEVDLYLAGHDHSRQWLAPSCGVALAVSGAGAKTTGFVDRGHPSSFAASTPGFVWVELDGPRMTARFYDKEGVEEHVEVVEKPAG